MSDKPTTSMTRAQETTTAESATPSDVHFSDTRASAGVEESKSSDATTVLDGMNPLARKRKIFEMMSSIRHERKEAKMMKDVTGADPSPSLDQKILVSSPPPPVLPTNEELYRNNLKIFGHAYEGSRSYRIHLGAKDDVYAKLVDTYIETSDVLTAIRQACEEPNVGFVAKRQLGSLAPDSVESAAQSAVYFGSFIRDQFPEMASANTNEVIRYLNEKKAVADGFEGFVGILVLFHDYYARLPCARRSPYKLEQCQKEDVLGRAYNKELSTLRTVIRGLLCYFTMIGMVPVSSPKSPDPLCSKIWLAINSTQKNYNITVSGAVKKEKWPLTLVDIVELMGRTEGVRTQGDCQAWLYSLVLSGIGLRPGSVKTQRVRAADAINEELKQEKKKPSTEEQNYNGGCDDDDDDEQKDDVKGNEIDVTGLRAKHIRIFIKAKKEGDRDVRLRVELKVRKHNVTSTKTFAHTAIDLHHPTSLAEDKENWSPGAALALTLLCISAKTVDPDRVSIEMAPEEGEIEITKIAEYGENPIFRRVELGKRGLLSDEPMVHEQPIFERLLHSLRIPHSTYSAKSLLCGFAEMILTDHVIRKAPAELVSREHIRSAFYTAGRWSSAQADTYIRQSIGTLDRYGTFDAASDWLRIRFRSMACARTASPSYRVYTVEDARRKMNQDLPGVVMESRELSDMARVMTYESFHEAEPVDKTDAEIRSFFLDRPTVNVRSAVEEYCTMMGLDVGNFPFFKIARKTFRRLNAPFSCLVVECHQSFSTPRELNMHWEECHEDNRRTLRYECPCGRSNALWKGFLVHLKKVHKFKVTGEDLTFNWRMRGSHDEEEEEEIEEQQPSTSTPNSSAYSRRPRHNIPGLIDSDDEFIL